MKPVTSVKTSGARENYAEAALKQMQQRASAMDEVAARRRRHERDAAAAWTRQRERDVTAAQRARAATRAAAAPTVIVDRVAPPRRDPPLVDRRPVPRGGPFAPTQQYAAPAAAPAVVDAAPAAAAVAEEPVAAPLVRKTPIGADLFTQLGGAFLVLLAVMAAPSFSGQMACVAASVVGYQLRALQAFFGPSN